MNRNIFSSEQIHPAIRAQVAEFNAQVIGDVQAAIASNDVVVVGMRQNPFPKKARQMLDAAGVAHRYMEYGSYFGEWRPRLALKMWTGWPTFPMIFVKGTFVGGSSDLDKLIQSGDLKKMLSQ